MQKNLRSYTYSAKPKVLSNSNGNRIKQILKSGNVDKVEKIIRDGHGYHLIGEFSSDPKIRSLLKSVPFYMARIDMLHDAVTKGQLRDLQILLDTTSPVFSVLKPKAENLVSCIDNAGVGLLHKAVYYDHPHIIEWLIHHYPATMKMRDKMGRIPLHYVNSMTNPERNWQLLVENGSPVDVKDVNGRTPDFYLNGSDEIHLPGKSLYSELNEEGIVVKPSNIRIWIHDQDIPRLREVIWQGYGDKLRIQTCNKVTMKKFLNAVPHIMTMIREIHKAAIENNVDILAMLSRPPVPAVILKSKDDKGITALHKACGLGNIRVVTYILQTYPEAIHIRDNRGRTSIHYAALFKQELIYEELLKAGANEQLIDKNNKTAKYYRHKTDGIHDVESLYELPISPQTGLSVIDKAFDWSILGYSESSTLNEDPDPPQYADLLIQTNEPLAKADKISNEISVTDDAEFLVLHTGDSNESTWSTKEPPDDTQSRLNTEQCTVDLQLHPSTDLDEELARQSNVDRLFELLGQNAEVPDVEFQFVEQVHSLENETTNSSERENENAEELECYSNTTAPCVDSENSVAKTEPLAHSNEKSEICSMHDILSHKLSGEKELRLAVDNVLRNENLAEIGELILAGYGEWLLPVKSENQTIRELVRHLPIYLKKIELIHRCCEIGNVEELRKYLDRRKLSVARESKSDLFLTPLHVAVAFNRIEVARHLGGRFPETLHQQDKLGRTPLHYAAMRADGKFAYNTLLTLGANKDLEDHNGHSAQFYYDNHEEGYHNELLDIVEKLKSNSAKQMIETDKTSSLMEELAFDRIESEYLITVLGEVLKSGLFAVARTKPSKPIKFLADYLSKYEYNASQTSPQKTDSANELDTGEEMKLEKDIPNNFFSLGLNDDWYSGEEAIPKKVEECDKVEQSEEANGSETANAPVVEANESAMATNTPVAQSAAKESQPRQCEQNLRNTPPLDENGSPLNYSPASNVFLPLSRDEYGRTEIHLAASKKQGRNYLLQMLQDLKANVAYRDEFYRTARDVAALSQIYENVKAIDAYVVRIAANGENDKIITLLTDGYDRILETETEENILTVAERRNHQTTLSILKTVPIFEDTRERLHTAIKHGDKLQVTEMLRKCGKDATLMATSKNEMCRCSLHIAILAQRRDIVRYLVKKFPTTLHIGDNLERTPLHYAMALEEVEEFSTILIRGGAQRTAKDLKGRQPTYYFMNKDEILRMQHEEIYLNRNMENRPRRKS